ncbi:MAG: uL30 family ribosomal protein [Candidatus Marsarchaeota archaeon]|nr:uL30 family ribosomal protein [Candidatus Marsarchaeota archaeon]
MKKLFILFDAIINTFILFLSLRVFMKDKKLIAIVRIRGRVKISSAIEETLGRLRLYRVNNCVVLHADDSYKGMIKKCENHVAYGEIDESTAKKLFKKYVPNMNADDILNNKIDIKELKPYLPFRLTPPKRGYKAIKVSFNNGGSLGNMGEHINELLNRMV